MMVDAYSGYTVASSLPSLSAENVMNCFLDKWVSHYTFPLELVSDNGSEFANNIFSTLCTKLGVTHIKTTPYHSRSNGLAERRIRALNEFLRSYGSGSNHNPLNWCTLLPSFNLIFNATRGPYGYTPYFLAHGQEASLPMQKFLHGDKMLNDSFIAEKINEMARAAKVVHRNREHLFLQNKTQFDKKARTFTCHEGDQVFIDEQKGHPRKLDTKFSGPYTVTKDEDDYVLVFKGKYGKIKKIHKDRIRLAPTRKQFFPGHDSTPPSSAHITHLTPPNKLSDNQCDSDDEFVYLGPHGEGDADHPPGHDHQGMEGENPHSEDNEEDQGEPTGAPGQEHDHMEPPHFMAGGEDPAESHDSPEEDLQSSSPEDSTSPNPAPDDPITSGTNDEPATTSLARTEGGDQLDRPGGSRGRGQRGGASSTGTGRGQTSAQGSGGARPKVRGGASGGNFKGSQSSLHSVKSGTGSIKEPSKLTRALAKQLGINIPDRKPGEDITPRTIPERKIKKKNSK